MPAFLRDDAPPVRRRSLPAAAVLVTFLVTGSLTLTGCVTAEPPVSSVQLTAGGGTCKLPTLTVEPTTFDPGDTVKLTGAWFVKGCGGSPGTTPLELISAVLTDAKGENLSFSPIASEGTEGRFETEYKVPKNAAKGPGKITVGQAGPVPVVVGD